MTEDADYPRSLYEVRMDICFKAKVHALHERLYARLDKGVKAIELIASSGAFYAVTAGYTGTTKVCALIVTIFVLLSLVYDFGGRAREMRDMMRGDWPAAMAQAMQVWGIYGALGGTGFRSQPGEPGSTVMRRHVVRVDAHGASLQVHSA